MSNFFTAIKILKALGMIKASESQSENSLVDAISKNFRISKTDTEDPFQFIDAWVVSYESGAFDSYLNKRKERVYFYSSLEWAGLRSKASRLLGHKCGKCGSKKNLQVDHVVSRMKDKSRELDLTNLQILCKSCNLDKSASCKDYRTPEQIKILQDYLEKVG